MLPLPHLALTWTSVEGIGFSLCTQLCRWCWRPKHYYGTTGRQASPVAARAACVSSVALGEQGDGLGRLVLRRIGAERLDHVFWWMQPGIINIRCCAVVFVLSVVAEFEIAGARHDAVGGASLPAV